MRRPVFFRPYCALGLLVSCAIAAAAGQAVAGAGQVTPVPTLETRTLAAINELRRDHGMLPLRPSETLASEAQSHSLSMAEIGYFAHNSADGSAFRVRVAEVLRGYKALGETLAWASPTLSAEQTLALWLQSPHHRQTILTPGWREIGLGAVHSSSAPGVFRGLEVTILTADFGR
jgi:uncharacterized protein YkwD